MMNIKRVVLIVLDSVGIGEMPDALAYGDAGCKTLQHTAEAVGGLNLPNLERLGLGKIAPIRGLNEHLPAFGCYGKMAERSIGKDTTTGHWEMMGIVQTKPFAAFPDGFPKEITEPFKAIVGGDFLGNFAASGTEIIAKLGEEHMKTKKPIIYTSADSVFQIAAHESVIPLERLYEICEKTRKLLDPYLVARVIARPFEGTPGNFVRTKNRRDFSLAPNGQMVLDYLLEADIPVIGVGKIWDIFNGQGISKKRKAGGNEDAIMETILAMDECLEGLIFTNLVDFDMLYGHRRNPQGYATALSQFDQSLPEILKRLLPQDLLLISADHGCDPTATHSTDHTREYVPLIAYRGTNQKQGVHLGTRSSFCDIGATIADVFQVKDPSCSESFLAQVLLGETF